MASEKVAARVNDERKAVVDALISIMEEKGLSWTMEWNQATFSPHNGLSEHRYQGRNRIHLMIRAKMSGFEDPRWFTYNQAKKLGYHPKKGEKSSIIEKWGTYGVLVDADGNRVYDSELADHIERWPVLQAYYTLFNAEQLVDKDNNPMPPYEFKVMLEKDDPALNKMADDLITSSRCKVNESKTNGEACYRPGTDEIDVPPRTAFKSMEGFITTLTHEMAHSTMKPLNRKEASGNFFGSSKYAFEELVAELGSTFTCTDLGIHRTAELESDENFTNHAAYLKSWMRKLKDDPDYLFQAASKAGDAADYIMDGYNKVTGGDGPGTPSRERLRTREVAKIAERVEPQLEFAFLDDNEPAPEALLPVAHAPASANYSVKIEGTPYSVELESANRLLVNKDGQNVGSVTGVASMSEYKLCGALMAEVGIPESDEEFDILQDAVFDAASDVVDYIKDGNAFMEEARRAPEVPRAAKISAPKPKERTESPAQDLKKMGQNARAMHNAARPARPVRAARG